MWLHLFCVVGFIPFHSLLSLSSLMRILSFISLSLSFFLNPTEKWRIRCRYSVSSSARPSASLMSAWPLWSCRPMFWGASPCRFLFPFKSAPFYPNSSAMKADWCIYPLLPLLVCYHPLLCFLSPQGSPNRVNFQSSYQWPSFGHQWLWGKSSPLHPL